MERGRPQGGRKGRSDAAAAVSAEKAGRPDRVERVVEQKKGCVRGSRLDTTVIPYRTKWYTVCSGKGARDASWQRWWCDF